MIQKKKFLPLVLIAISLLVFGFSSDSKNQAMIKAKKTKILGTIIKNALETYHYRDLKINDDVSRKAFKEFLKKIDYGKQFLTKSEVKELNKFEFSMDDQMVSGEHKLVNKAKHMVIKRVKHIDGLRKKYFKKHFAFNKKENLQLDPEKRDYQKSGKSLDKLWKKIFKHSVLNRYLSYVENQEDSKKKKKETKKSKSKKKKKKEKLMTDAEMRKKAHDSISKKYERIFKRLMEETEDDYVEKFMNSIAGIFDPHTDYLAPRQKEDFDIDISGSLEGIGAVLQEDGSYIKVVKVVPGGAAWRQKGLEVDDVILAVGEGNKDPVDLVDMRVDNAVRYIRGKKGTVVKLTVKKVDGTRKIIPITRDVVQIGASFAKSSVIKHSELGIKIGYIHVPKFYRDFGNNERNCTDDVKKELVRLKKFNIDAVILDLRNNGGGALVDATNMSGLFVKKGPIVQVRSHTGQIEVHKDNDPSITYKGPLIVMTNRFSASASEILAGALQDYGRAIIVGGEHSHGKGTVQAVLNLNQGPIRQLFGPTMGALKVTIQKFYRVNGESTQYKGVTPQIILPDPYSYAKNREKDLDYSLPWDKVPAQKYIPWNGFQYNLSKLKNRSVKRVKSNKRLQKIMQSVKYLSKKRDDTIASLNIDEVKKEDLENKKMTDKLKWDEENKKLDVTHFEESLLANEKIQKNEMKKWKEDFKQRKKEWVESLRKDPGLEEAIFIAHDMVQMKKGGKLSMVK